VVALPSSAEQPFLQKPALYEPRTAINRKPTPQVSLPSLNNAITKKDFTTFTEELGFFSEDPWSF